MTGGREGLLQNINSSNAFLHGLKNFVKINCLFSLFAEILETLATSPENIHTAYISSYFNAFCMKTGGLIPPSNDE